MSHLPSLNRRRLLRHLGLASGAIALPPLLNRFAANRPQVSPPAQASVLKSVVETEGAPLMAAAGNSPHRVVLVKTSDRAAGVQQAVELLQPVSFANKRVFIKPNYNTGDPAPAATDPAVLEALVQIVKADGASQITVGDRSGMAETRGAMQRKGVFDLAERHGFNTLVFDELGRDDWQYFDAAGTSWSQGFAIAKPILDSDAIINTCCLKTHRFGGHFTLSLKNTVGMVARTVPGDPHDYMRELHRSANQRLMIADINKTYRPALIIIDGVEAFINGGPEQGQLAQPGVILASTDRIAIDAVGIAILRMLGTTPEVSQGSIWNLTQIRRAADLGLGAVSADQIEWVTADGASEAMVRDLQPYLI
ncbi:MAG: DUF362 domain-containing protein [Cyanobacteria bacterium P01_A01_bin.114]